MHEKSRGRDTGASGMVPPMVVEPHDETPTTSLPRVGRDFELRRSLPPGAGLVHTDHHGRPGFPPIDRWPQNRRAVTAGGECRATIVREVDRGEVLRVAREREDLLTGRRIPQLGRGVLAAGQESLAIGGKGYAGDAGGVA